MTPVLVVNEKRQKGLYLNGELCGTWDKHDSDAHVWEQVALKTDADEVEERVIEGPLPPKVEPAKGKAAKVKPKEAAEKASEPDDTPKGPTTSYHTGNGNVEAI